jgi:hypothetical protein
MVLWGIIRKINKYSFLRLHFFEPFQIRGFIFFYHIRIVFKCSFAMYESKRTTFAGKRVTH